MKYNVYAIQGDWQNRIWFGHFNDYEKAKELCDAVAKLTSEADTPPRAIKIYIDSTEEIIVGKTEEKEAEG